MIAATDRPQKITLGEVRVAGARRLLVYCADYRCSHAVILGADRWSDEIRLSDLEPLFTCQACGQALPPPSSIRRIGSSPQKCS